MTQAVPWNLPKCPDCVGMCGDPFPESGMCSRGFWPRTHEDVMAGDLGALPIKVYGRRHAEDMGVASRVVESLDGRAGLFKVSVPGYGLYQVEVQSRQIVVHCPGATDKGGSG